MVLYRQTTIREGNRELNTQRTATVWTGAAARTLPEMKGSGQSCCVMLCCWEPRPAPTPAFHTAGTAVRSPALQPLRLFHTIGSATRSPSLHPLQPLSHNRDCGKESHPAPTAAIHTTGTATRSPTLHPLQPLSHNRD